MLKIQLRHGERIKRLMTVPERSAAARKARSRNHFVVQVNS